jgi:hypothetical protein
MNRLVSRPRSPAKCPGRPARRCWAASSWPTTLSRHSMIMAGLPAGRGVERRPRADIPRPAGPRTSSPLRWPGTTRTIRPNSGRSSWPGPRPAPIPAAPLVDEQREPATPDRVAANHSTGASRRPIGSRRSTDPCGCDPSIAGTDGRPPARGGRDSTSASIIAEPVGRGGWASATSRCCRGEEQAEYPQAVEAQQCPSEV